MVSFYIPANAKLVEGATSASDAYVRLRNRGYLSIRALLNRHKVEELIQETWNAYPKDPEEGRERSRDVVGALCRAIPDSPQRMSLRMQSRDWRYTPSVGINFLRTASLRSHPCSKRGVHAWSSPF